jgi:hypothetical protein
LCALDGLADAPVEAVPSEKLRAGQVSLHGRVWKSRALPGACLRQGWREFQCFGGGVPAEGCAREGARENYNDVNHADVASSEEGEQTCSDENDGDHAGVGPSEEGEQACSDDTDGDHAGVGPSEEGEQACSDDTDIDHAGVGSSDQGEQACTDDNDMDATDVRSSDKGDKAGTELRSTFPEEFGAQYSNVFRGEPSQYIRVAPQTITMEPGVVRTIHRRQGR